MSEPREARRRQDARLRSPRNLGDARRRAGRRADLGWLAGAAAVVAGLAAGLFIAGHHGSSGHRGPSSRPKGPASVPGIEIAGGQRLLGTLERRDSAVETGPWAIVVRPDGGSLALHSAVITFPAQPASAGAAIRVHGRTGHALPGSITWSLGGSFARVRGDLGTAQLTSIAQATSVSRGRPKVKPPNGLRVVSTGPYWPLVEREARYGTATLGELGTLGSGLTVAGVTSAGGGFEDQLFVRGIRARLTIDGQPTVVAEIDNAPPSPSPLSGNGELAWEPIPGIVAVVGYRGHSLDGPAIAALGRIAGRARLVAEPAWRATHPQLVTQGLPQPVLPASVTTGPRAGLVQAAAVRNVPAPDAVRRAPQEPAYRPRSG